MRQPGVGNDSSLQHTTAQFGAAEAQRSRRPSVGRYSSVSLQFRQRVLTERRVSRKRRAKDYSAFVTFIIESA